MASTVALALDGVQDGGAELVPDHHWTPTSNLHDAPVVKVSEPKGAFCQMDSRFSVPLAPDDVYDIITDPNNRRVFKNVKEVTYRKVLEDDGHRQLVELEQQGRWRFLVFSGSFACRVMVDQNKKEHTMDVKLAKQGFMKKFFGTWKIEPIFDDDLTSGADVESKEGKTSPASKVGTSEAGSASSASETKLEKSNKKLTGSWVTLHQEVQPALVPPWPLNKYVRGVCGQIVQDVCADLQVEAIRLAELQASSAHKKDTDMNDLD